MSSLRSWQQSDPFPIPQGFRRHTCALCEDRDAECLSHGSPRNTIKLTPGERCKGLSSARPVGRQLNHNAPILYPTKGATPLNVTFLKALVVLFPACLLLFGSTVLFLRRKTVFPFMQLFGAGCIVAVALAHVCEALHLFPGMHWGLEHSTGHYVDLASAVLGLTFFPAGYFFHALSSK